MKIFTTILGIGLFATSLVKADYPVNCQMKILSSAIDAYTVYFNEFTVLFAIDTITFGVEQGTERPFAVYHSSKALAKKRDCSVTVFMKKPAPVLGCPDYEVDAVTTDCN